MVRLTPFDLLGPHVPTTAEESRNSTESRALPSFQLRAQQRLRLRHVSRTRRDLGPIFPPRPPPFRPTKPGTLPPPRPKPPSHRKGEGSEVGAAGSRTRLVHGVVAAGAGLHVGAHVGRELEDLPSMRWRAEGWNPYPIRVTNPSHGSASRNFCAWHAGRSRLEPNHGPQWPVKVSRHKISPPPSPSPSNFKVPFTLPTGGMTRAAPPLSHLRVCQPPTLDRRVFTSLAHAAATKALVDATAGMMCLATP